MGASNKPKRPEHHFSLLVMPDEKQSELYYWYNGNPFGLSRKSSAIVDLDGQIMGTEPIDSKSKEVVAAMARLSEGIGYLIAKTDCLVINVPTRDWSKLANEMLKFFPGGHSAVHRVLDETKEIAGIEDARKRIRRVRAVEGPFATRWASEIDAFRLPAPAVEAPPEINNNAPVYEEPQRQAA